MTRRPESDVRLDVEPGTARPAGRPVEAPTFHVAVLGDFRGRADRDPGGRPERLEPVPVDRDDVDRVLAAWEPRLRLAAGAGADAVEVSFREIDDFHPDRLVERVSLFRSIREVASSGRAAPSPPPGDRGSGRPAPLEEMLSGSVLDRIVEAGDEGPGEGGPARDPLQAWVEDIVRPHLEEAPDPDDQRLASRVEALVADGVRELLRDPAVRRLEALWRGVDFLVRSVETGPRLTVHLVDVTPGELATDGGGAALDALLRRGAGPRGEPWSVLAATWEVGPEPDDLVLLRTLAARARAAGAVLLAGARPAPAGLPTLADAGDRSAWEEVPRLWSALRREPEAAAVGLALPRFLLRLPYGADGEPCQGVALEEIRGVPSPDDYVWGPAVLPLVVMLARAFARAGARLVDAFDPEVGSLPLHVHRGNGEPRATPCTEVALTRDDADRLTDAGLMPFAWSRGSDAIRLLRLHSVADPPAALAGWWRG